MDTASLRRKLVSEAKPNALPQAGRTKSHACLPLLRRITVHASIRFSALSLYEQFGVRFEVRFHFIFEHCVRKFFAELYAFLIETVDIP